MLRQDFPTGFKKVKLLGGFYANTVKSQRWHCLLSRIE